MQIRIETDNAVPADEPRVGNVYPVRGGRGARDGLLQIIIAIAEPKDRFDGEMALLLVVDKEGKPRSVNRYGMHYVRDLTPIAFVDGLDDLDLVMRTVMPRSVELNEADNKARLVVRPVEFTTPEQVERFIAALRIGASAVWPQPTARETGNSEAKH